MDLADAPVSHALLASYPAMAGVLAHADAAGALAGPLAVPAGTTLFHENEPCKGFPLVLEGEVRVSRSSGDGRTLELYRIGPGELCLVSSACLFRTEPMSAHAVATRDSTLYVVPPGIFSRWLDDAAFRAFILGLFAQRMADLTALIDAVAFHKLDQRLAAALLGHGPQLLTTHQDLADGLGTVREMVTRLLRRFEREGWIALSRERIRILDSAALRRCAGPV
jgi:CRP/FNR family transcriptional regulator